MARKFLVPIDLSKQELQNAVIQNLATAPSSPVEGQIYYDTDTNIVYFWNGTEWVSTETEPYTYGSGQTTTIDIGDTTAADGTSLALARADHEHAGPGFGNVTAQTSFGASSGNGSATTVARSDHSHGTPAHDAAAHSAIKLSDLAAPSTDVSLASHKLTNVTDPTSAQDAATKAYVDGRKVTDLTAPTSAFSMNSNKITNVATPTTDYDAANKLYVDQAVQGLTWKESVNLMSTTNVALTGSTGLVIDGHSALDSADNGYRILLTGQSTGSENGIYTFSDNGTTYTLARATDADTHDELIGATVFIKEGTSYGSTSWVQTNHYLTGFTGQTWVQFSGAGTYTASNGVVLDVKDFKFAPKTDGGLATGTSGGFVKLPTNSGLGTTSDGLAVGAGTGITVSGGTVALTNTSVTVNGNSVSLGGSTTITANTTNALTLGTGLTGTSFNGSAAVTAAIDTSVVARKYSTALTGSATSYTVTHNLGTRDVQVSVRETGSPYAKVEPDIAMATTNTVTISFAVAPTSDQYTVTVVG